jgi:hypothetical protein
MGYPLNALIATIKRFLGTQSIGLNVNQNFQWTGYRNVKDRNELIDAILTAYDNTAYKAVMLDGQIVKTFCNIAANEIAQKMGCKDLYDEDHKRPRTADEIYDFMATHSNAKDESRWSWTEILCASLQPEFRDVAFQAAQWWANSGNLVFAVQSSYNLGANHGHICVIRPGVMKTSGRWGRVPACMNIGGDNFIALGQKGVMKGLPVGINEAFQQIPRFFAWRGL